jgi:hypothetical protein
MENTTLVDGSENVHECTLRQTNSVNRRLIDPSWNNP